MTLLRLLAVSGLSALLSAVAVAPASAQATTGEITGRVEDAAGSIVPAVTVTALNTETGFARSTLTNAEGTYVLTSLPPGRYAVSAELTGFKKAVRENVIVAVGTRQTLPIRLEIGAISESVAVSADAPLVETTRSELSGVVTSGDIANLPALNRTFANLAMTMPEARPAGGFDPTKTRVGNFAMNGGDGRQLDVNVDGGDNKDNVVGSLLQNFAYEGIQEFQVLQHRWSAESGRAVGGVVNVISKSGTNNLRGSGFGTFRNDSLVAKDFFQNRGATKPDFERWEYGGSVGGPIRRDNLFFFGALERFDEPGAQTPIRSDAIFAELSAIPGAQPVRTIPTPYDDTLLTLKVDQRLTDRQNMLYRFAWQKNASPNDQIPNPALTDLSGGNSNTNDLYDFVGRHTMSRGANQLNEFTFHFQDFQNEILPVTDAPILLFATEGLRTGPAPNTPQATSERKFQIRDDFSWFRGNHGLKFGTNYIHTKLGGYFYFGAFGYELRFFDDPTVITTNTTRYPQGFATPGAVRLLNYFAGEATHDQNFHQLAFYAQDDWRVGRNLTLNLGLRWDANIGLLPDQTNNRTIQLLSQLDDPRAREITSDADKLARTTPSWKEFQPRLGFAYDVNGDASLAVRGGYGIFYDQIFQNLTVFSMSQSGPEFYSTDSGLHQLHRRRRTAAEFPLRGRSAAAAAGVHVRGAARRIVRPYQRSRRERSLRAQDVDRLRNDPARQLDPVERLRAYAGELGIARAGDQSADSFDLRSRFRRLHSLGCTLRQRPHDALFRCGVRPCGARRQPARTDQHDRHDQRIEIRLAHDHRAGPHRPHDTVAELRARPAPARGAVSRRPRTAATELRLRPRCSSSMRNGGRRGTTSAIGSSPAARSTSGEGSRWRRSSSGRRRGRTRRPSGSTATAMDRPTSSIGCAKAPTSPPCSRPAGTGPQSRRSIRTAASVFSVNNQRSGFVVNPDGSIEERSGRFFNVDLRVAKDFTFGARALRVYADFFNLFNTENLSFTLRPEQSPATSASGFMQPVSLYGPGFGPPVGRPFTASFGGRIDF